VAEALLAMLGRQALLLSMAAGLLMLARPLLLRRCGARAAYAAWLMVPAMLLTPALPQLAPLPAPLTVIWGETLPGAATAALAPVAPSGSVLVLAAWLGGAVAVLALQALRQWRLAQLGPVLPAGASPALVGWLRPHVALPVDFELRFTPEERRLILAHEQVHRERGDNAWNLLACALAALHWWNPLAWMAVRRLRADQELACDAVVLTRHPGGRAAYTRALLAAHDLTPTHAPLASRWGTTHPLVERIAMLNRPHTLPRRRALALGLALTIVVGLAYAAQGGEPAQATRADGTAPTIELKLDLSYVTRSGDTRNTYRTQPTLRIASGKRAMVMLKGSPAQPMPDQIAVDIEATDLGDGRIELLADLKKGDPLITVSRPRLITLNGVKARIEQGRDDPSAVEHLSMAVTPTLLTEPGAAAR
jgi:beta-lactamase regulating signal transducer with metallopeptidase domain